jgi:hypothetical protein
MIRRRFFQLLACLPWWRPKPDRDFVITKVEADSFEMAIQPEPKRKHCTIRGERCTLKFCNSKPGNCLASDIDLNRIISGATPDAYNGMFVQSANDENFGITADDLEAFDFD